MWKAKQLRGLRISHPRASHPRVSHPRVSHPSQDSQHEDVVKGAAGRQEGGGQGVEAGEKTSRMILLGSKRVRDDLEEYECENRSLMSIAPVEEKKISGFDTILSCFLSFFLSFFLGWRTPNLITGLSGW